MKLTYLFTTSESDSPKIFVHPNDPQDIYSTKLGTAK